MNVPHLAQRPERSAPPAPTRPALEGLVLPASIALEEDALRITAEFPSVEVTTHAADAIAIDAEAWSRAETFLPFDELVASSSATHLAVRGEHDLVRSAIEILTRYQRFLHHRNGASTGAFFDAVLHRRALAGNADRGLDTWQWLLRLAPSAPLALQLSALSDGRDEGEAGRSPVLDDARSLSFLSLESDGFLDAFGPDATARRLASLLASLGGEARERLPFVRLRRDVAEIACMR